MHVETSAVFIKFYRRLPARIKERSKKVLELLQVNPSHPSLGHKKMAGYEDLYELRVSDNYRITYRKISDVAYLLKIGTHDLLRNP